MEPRPPVLAALRWLLATPPLPGADLLGSAMPGRGWRAHPHPLLGGAAMYVWAAGDLQPGLASLVRLSKYGGNWPLAMALSRQAMHIQPSGVLQEADLLVPMPPDPRRLAQRGYHLPALFCAQASRRLGIPMARSALRRTRSLPAMAGLRREARWALAVGPLVESLRASPQVLGRQVLLVDDVLTTGASLGAAWHCLEQHGAEVLGGLVIGRVPPRPIHSGHATPIPAHRAG